VTVAAVLFDLDRTLLDRDAAVVAYATQLWRSAGDPGTAAGQDFVSRFVDLDARGCTDKHVYFRQLKSEFRLAADLQEMLDRFETTFPSTVRPFEEALPLLRLLKTAGVRCGVVTNGHSKGQRQKLERSGFLPFMDTIAISEELGIAKPDSKIFHHALANIDCQANDSLFVGDSEEADIRGAGNAGMRAVLRRHAGDRFPTAAQFQVESLAEVWTVVASCNGIGINRKQPSHGGAKP
jgi:putative hydrolase of the HAD superfamily